MKKFIIILFVLLSWSLKGQDYDFQELCIACSEQEGFYCGDDPANWTQYAPDGCVQNSWLNDGWEDCIDASDENGAVPTSPLDCAPPIPECDTVYVNIEVPVIEYIYEIDTLEVPFFIYETIIQLDTIIETEYITNIVIDTLEVEVMVPEYIYVTDTVYAEVLDTMFIDVVEYVEVVVFDTITETEYVEFFVTDTVMEYIEVIETEYIDCETGMPCNSSIGEILDKSKADGLMYNILGQPIRRPQSIYIQDGKIKYIMN
jgi:hypothetical protein